MPQCHVCQSEVSPEDAFCHNCGTRLTPLMSPGSVPHGEGQRLPGEQPERKGTKVALALVIVAILLLAAFVFILTPGISTTHSSSSSSITSAATTNCPTSTVSTTVSEPTPNYDVQQVMVFTGSYPQLEFNVTAMAQCDSNGYGPSYLLNGLTNTGYWYQVGINWDWPLQSGGYLPGFGFVSEAWAPGGFTRAPSTGTFSGPVNTGDVVELRLSFASNEVVASARDLNTSSSATMSYVSRGATAFLGSQAQESSGRFSFATQGYFTGLMTEWYHVDANYTGPEQGVKYSEELTSIGSATIAVGEWNFTTSTPSSVFSDVANNGYPISFTQPIQVQQFSLDGYTVSADGYEFVTGS